MDLVSPAVLALPVLRRGEGLGLGLGLRSRPAAPPPPPGEATAAGGSSQEAAGDGVAGCCCCWPRMTGEKAAPGEPVAVGMSADEMTAGVPGKDWLRVRRTVAAQR